MAFMDYIPQFGQNIPNQNVGVQNDTTAQLLLKRRLAQADALRNQEAPQGQMVSGHYVAPSWTQYLANIANQYVGGKEEEKAMQQYGEYETGKQKRLADALEQYNKDIADRTIQPEQQAPTITGSTGEMAPNMGMVNAPARTVPVSAADRYNALMRYSAATQNPELTQRAMLGGIEFAGKQEETAGERAWREKQTANEQEFTRIRDKERQGFELTQQEKNFANQMALQKSSQNFQAANAPLVSVLDTVTGKPKLVTRQQAQGMQPYSAAQEAKDVVKVQQKAQNEISAQQVLDQAQLLFSHPGRKAGTGASSWMGIIPNTDAKDFSVNLQTFKAQTFVPMVQALKGMGALSDAEGKKLVDSVGALDPSVNEAAFVRNLQNATRTLYQKAKAAGLNVVEPDFLQNQTKAAAPSAVRQQADAILGL